MTSIELAKRILSVSLFVPVDRIADDATINDIKELDSLAFEALVLEIEEHTGKEVDPVDLLTMKTVQDLAALVVKMQ